MEKKTIITAAATLVVGLVIGYFVFGGTSTPSEEEHVHTKTTDAQGEEIWTCSMHPQIRQPEPGDCPICGMTLIPADGNANSDPMVFEMTEDAIKIANIQTTKIGGASSSSIDMEAGLKLSGKIQANETTSASIVSHIPGRIEKLFVSFTGEKVSKGKKIATIYSANLITAQKELIEAHKVKEVNPKLFEATKNKLKYWKITDTQIDNILSEGKVMETFNIYADYSGVVQELKVSVGDHLMEGGVLFKVQNLNKLWVLFDVYEDQLPLVKIGDVISFTTPSVANKVFDAKVSFIDPVINPTTRTAAVRLQINNNKQLLKPEMFVKGVLQTASSSNQTNTQAVVVPKTAILWTGERSVVYIKLPNTTVPSFEFREVQLGSAIGGSYIVLDGLASGDEVVTNGAFVIDASAQLNNQTSMMNRNLLGAVADETTEEEIPNYTAEASGQFRTQLEAVTNQYLKVKDAFVATDATIAIADAKSLQQQLSKVDMKLVKGDGHMYWMKQMKIIKEKAQEIIDTEDVEKQRKAFDLLSMAIINSNKAFGVSTQTYYVQYCPMAIDDDGSFWLSADEKVKNPYFGDQMLGCGEVKETLSK